MLKYDVTIDLNSYNRAIMSELTPWRNGSASDSRSEGCVFKSRRGQFSFLLFSIFLTATIIITTKPKTFITDLFIMQYFKCGKKDIVQRTFFIDIAPIVFFFYDAATRL